ncbi:MAG: hypothetical protein ACREC6_08170 [Hyphomicrobiaceae bacterium]
MVRTTPRVVVGAVLTAAMGGAVYLYAVRGTALLLDLAAAASRVFCF